MEENRVYHESVLGQRVSLNKLAGAKAIAKEEKVEETQEKSSICASGSIDESVSVHYEGSLEEENTDDENENPTGINRIIKDITDGVEGITNGSSQIHEQYKILPLTIISLVSIIGIFISLFTSLEAWSVSVLGGIVSFIVVLIASVWFTFICKSVKKIRHANRVFAGIAVIGLVVSIFPILIINVSGEASSIFTNKDIWQIGFILIYVFASMFALLAGLIEGIFGDLDSVWIRRALRIVCYTLGLFGILMVLYNHDTLITSSTGVWSGAYTVFLSSLIFFAGSLFESRDYQRNERINPKYQKLNIFLFLTYVLLMVGLLTIYIIIGLLREDLIKKLV
ncbi:hypothetical protein NEFER03_0779 [Nematocida sp. LUAm3]|nr:hypothetical protein NEFER03_0779 [Nematocida sp. LUAm3]KAI5175238.1 hypothetical protein NEFER02_1199 [Nematocida sp. LUAm2]KAI5178090.1 hypothetical protein NEFER01_1268 [Nematocida sp. LUAm1]